MVTVTTQATAYSPSFAIDPGNTSTLYISYTSSTRNLIFCTLNLTNNASNCQNPSGLHQMGYQPGMAFSGSALYMAFADNGGAHCLYLYQYLPASNSFTFSSNNNCASTTSYAPSVAVYSGIVWVGFRSNDGSHHYLLSSINNNLNFGDIRDSGQPMDGQLSLVNAPVAGTPSELYNVFSDNYDVTTVVGYR